MIKISYEYVIKTKQNKTKQKKKKQKEKLKSLFEILEYEYEVIKNVERWKPNLC